MWQRWTVVDVEDTAHRAAEAVTLEAPPSPRAAEYPLDLLLRVTYRLRAAGLHVQAHGEEPRSRHRSLRHRLPSVALAR